MAKKLYQSWLVRARRGSADLAIDNWSYQQWTKFIT